VSPSPAALDVVGEVTALLDDQAITITAQHDTILVDLPTKRPRWATSRRAGRRTERETRLRRVGAMLEFTGLTVQFRFMGTTVASLGAGAHPGWLSWIVGVRPMEVRPSAVLPLLRAALRRPFAGGS
jgi:hypothetical protein